MKPLTTTTRLSISLALIPILLLLCAQSLRLVPDYSNLQLKNRTKLCESIVIFMASSWKENQISTIRAAAPLLVERHPDILSLAIIDSDKNVLAETPNHTTRWKEREAEHYGATHVEIPLGQGKQKSGYVQLCFRPLVSRGIYGTLMSPWMRLTLLLGICGFPLYWLYLKRVLRHLDPSKVVPERAKAVLNSLSEGVLVLDNRAQIVLANNAFTNATGLSAAKLTGLKASKIPWSAVSSGDSKEDFPWEQTIRDGQEQKNVVLTLENDSKKIRTFVVNTSPIIGTDGKYRGAMATFDDVSEIEEKNTKLEKSLKQLRQSRNKIKEQNDELRQLSMHDPLTGCLNRRAFFERFDAEWSRNNRYEYSLGCIIIDIDHFKSINDTHGHSTGDAVLKEAAQFLSNTARQSDCVCRYGGEEFCILLPHTNLMEASNTAEKFRHLLESLSPGGVPVTASFGVSSDELGAASPQEMIDQADKALYKAKKSGRNRVVRWDMLAIEEEANASESNNESSPDQDAKVNIPFSAVTALMSALEFRDYGTAAHSRRVSDICVAVGKGLMPANDCFVLEIAALLHDIGKLGVPDAILLKPGPLTEEEWHVMDKHDKMGVDIIHASFASSELINIINNSHAWYGGSPRNDDLPTGQDIPLRSRILHLADTYDAITSDRVYRKARTQQEAFDELQRCAGLQFDPELVEYFTETIRARDENRLNMPLAENQAKALTIGLEMEKLGAVMEAQDVSQLAAVAEHLAAHATLLGLSEIVEAAHRISKACGPDADLAELTLQTTELLEHCRTHQQRYLAMRDIVDDKVDPLNGPPKKDWMVDYQTTEIQQTRNSALILLVEDNELNQEVVLNILEVAGYRCDVVENGIEAIDAVSQKPYDLVLMDCEMPEMDGFEATRIIREKEERGEISAISHDKIPIVALTANALEGDRERCLSAGMDDYVSKPFKPGELIHVIEFHLSSTPIQG
jgi:diguanylate cyclase (GGDEF)-like protein/PAS domain S-box-containing protein